MKKIVIIPVYKKNPSLGEINSFIQCLKILSSHSYSLITYRSLDVSFYTKILIENKIDYNIQYFDKIYFDSISGYNRLMLSHHFYERFDDCQYILMYQLDSWVFRDEFDYWCKQGYDFIGAPWININLLGWLNPAYYPRNLLYIHNFTNGKWLSPVGNGGFSLRKVNSFIFNLSLFNKSSSRWIANEDCFFSHYVKTFNPFFKIPEVKIALEFSFDSFPSIAFKLNNFKLPFGCHAYYRRNKYEYIENIEFWSKYINVIK